MRYRWRRILSGISLTKEASWKRNGAALALLAALLLAGCDMSLASPGISETGNPIVIANQAQAIYAASNCTGQTVTVVPQGGNLVDLGPANSTCEQVAYPSEIGYTQTGYVPIYSIHRATNAIRCIFQSGCNLRAGPSSTATIFYVLPFGQRVQGRGTTTAGTIMTDGSQYSWWEVIVPSTGQVADIYGTLTVAF
jgi:hypothetical protein